MSKERIPVLRPLLPSADDLLPYLRRIDANRIYSNWGPLVGEFTTRLAGFFSVPETTVVTASSGTAALVGAILGSAGRARVGKSVAITQGLTFVATLSAIEQCGYDVSVFDVEEQTWTLNPDLLMRSPRLDEVGLVVPVSAYGRPVEVAPWREFSHKTGIPVVIDAAACFDTINVDKEKYLGGVPVVISFHATKVFSTGEGGCVICPTEIHAERVAEALNFGFSLDRNSRSASINGKMSEYHAAVGLSSFDNWANTSALRDNVCEFYRAAFMKSENGVLVCWPKISGCYILAMFDTVNDADVCKKILSEINIEFRSWYGKGLHLQEYLLRRGVQVRLPNTESLCSLLVGLPFAGDLNDSERLRIISLTKLQKNYK